jgi:hypothetical protein
MIRYFFSILGILSVAVSSFGQKTAFAQAVEQMHFNVFERKPDKQILPFIKKYFPGFLSYKNENAPWSYTFKKKDFPHLDTTMHSFSFTTHPLIKAKFNSGRFDLVTYEKKDGLPLVASWSLFFSFESYSDALACFDSIYKIFDSLSKDKILFIKNNRRIAQLTDSDKISDTNCVEIVLVRDELYDDRYKVYFNITRHHHNN